MAKKKEIPTEAQEQIKLAVWLKKMNIRFTASANGGHRHYLEACKFKRMGVSPGFPDLTLPLPRKPYHGLYIELKRQGGGIVSPEQQDWIDYLNSVGYHASIVCGFEAAKNLVLWYISLTEN